MDTPIHQSEMPHISALWMKLNPFGTQLDIFDGKILLLFDLGLEANISWLFCLFYITRVVI